MKKINKAIVPEITQTTGIAKMSPQIAVGYGNWPDEDSKQGKYSRGNAHNRAMRSKKKSFKDYR